MLPHKFSTFWSSILMWLVRMLSSSLFSIVLPQHNNRPISPRKYGPAHVGRSVWRIVYGENIRLWHPLVPLVLFRFLLYRSLIIPWLAADMRERFVELSLCWKTCTGFLSLDVLTPKLMLRIWSAIVIIEKTRDEQKFKLKKTYPTSQLEVPQKIENWWNRVVSCRVMSCRIVSYCIISYRVVSYRMVWHGMVWYGMVWYGMVWYGNGMVWYGMVSYGIVSYVSYRIVSYRIVSYRIVSYRIISCRIVSYRIVSNRTVPYRIALHCIKY